MNGQADACTLLHRGGSAGRWGNLGLWSGSGVDYAQACSALALAVAQAAGLKAGDRVLGVACGEGEELRLWQATFGTAEVCGVEQDADAVQAAQASGLTVVQGSGIQLLDLGLPQARFDALLCVDAAYHLHPRSTFLQGAWQLLRPGGRLAYTDLLLDDAAPAHRRGLLRGAAWLCGLRADELLLSPTAQLQRVQAAGFEDSTLQRLDAAVLDGFAQHVQRQARQLGLSVWNAGWRRPAITARLIAPCRAAGLGYALIAARRPVSSKACASSATDASSASATA